MIEKADLERKLAWCREHIPHFRVMEEQSRAAKAHTAQVREQVMKEKLGYENINS